MKGGGPEEVGKGSLIFYPPSKEGSPSILHSIERGHLSFFHILKGWVVRKAVNANPGLKVNRVNNYSCMEMFSAAYSLCSLTLLKLKDKQYKQKTLLKSYKSEIKILANPGVA